MTAASRILEADRQALWEERRQQGAPGREQKSDWCIARLAVYLPPDQVALAERLMELRAKIGAPRAPVLERVAGGGEPGLRFMTRGMREFFDYQAAALARCGPMGYSCFDGITRRMTRDQLAVRVGLSVRSKRSLIKLVQITMDAMAEKRDELAAERGA